MMKKIIKVVMIENLRREVYKLIIHYSDGSREIVNKDALEYGELL